MSGKTKKPAAAPVRVVEQTKRGPGLAKTKPPKIAIGSASAVPSEFAHLVSAGVWLPVEELHRWLKNPRKNAKAVPRVRLSIEKFGFVAPICLWTSKRRMVAGHTRLDAFEELRKEKGAAWAPKNAPGPGLIKVTFHEFVNEAEATAYAIADNRLGEIAEWDEGKKDVLLDDFRENRELFDATGYDFEEHFAEEPDPPPGDPDAGDASEGGTSTDKRDELPGDAATPDARDALPPEPKEARCKEGDLWILGEHRLLCGDSFNAAHRMRLLEGRVADAIVMDPPYGVYGSSTGLQANVADDKMTWPFFEKLFRTSAGCVKDFGLIYACCDWRTWASIWRGAAQAELSPKNMIVWDKGRGLGFCYAQCHELIAVFVREPVRRVMTRTLKHDGGVGKAEFARKITRGNILAVRRVSSGERVHNAQKPVLLIEEIVTDSTDEGETVLDFFGGSGTTLIACEALKRKACLMEAEPRECDKILARWEKLTGRTAERAAA